MASLMDSHSSRPEALRSLGAAPPGGGEEREEHEGEHQADCEELISSSGTLTLSCEHLDVDWSLHTDLLTDLEAAETCQSRAESSS